MQSTPYGIRTIELGAAQLLTWDGTRGDRVLVLCGSALLTQEGDTDDTMLDPGGEIALHDGRTLIEALRPLRLQLVRARSRPHWPLAAARRWRQRLQLGPASSEAAA